MTTSALAAISCPQAGCAHTEPNAIRLAGHLSNAHLISSEKCYPMALDAFLAITSLAPDVDVKVVRKPTTNPTAEGEPKRPETGPPSSPRPTGAATGDGRRSDDPARVERRSVARRTRRGPASPSSSPVTVPVTPVRQPKKRRKATGGGKRSKPATRRPARRRQIVRPVPQLLADVERGITEHERALRVLRLTRDALKAIA